MQIRKRGFDIEMRISNGRDAALRRYVFSVANFKERRSADWEQGVSLMMIAFDAKQMLAQRAVPTSRAR